MIRNFITTIEVYPEKITSKIDTCVLEALQAKYNLKCFEEFFIRSVTKIIKRGTLYCPRNIFNGIYLCDVNFSAECGSFNEGELMATTITDIDRESIMCQTSEYSLFIKYDPQIKLKVGNKIIVIITKVTYEIGTVVAINARIYKPVLKTQITAIVNKIEEIPGTDLCIKRLEELKTEIEKNDIAKKILRIFQFKRPSKMMFPPLSLLEKEEEKNSTSSRSSPQSGEGSDTSPIRSIGEDPIYFIINPLDPIEECIYRKAPFGTGESMLSADCPHIIRSDGCSLSAMKLKVMTSICNYLETILNMIKTQKEFEDNQIVWDFYIKNGSK